MFSNLRFRALFLVLVAILLAPAAAAASGTATVALHVQKRDRVMLTLSPKAKRTLGRQQVVLVARKPGMRSKSNYSLPAKSGRWNFSTGSGIVSLGGGLQIRSGRRAVNLGSVTFSRPVKGTSQVTVTVRGNKVRLFTIGGRARVKHSGVHETVAGMSARLAKPGVRLIDRLLRRRSLSTGELLGALTLTVTSASAPTSSPTATTRAASGVRLTFANQFSSMLGSPSSILPVGPASPGLPAPVGTTTIPGADGTQLTLPLATGSATAGFDYGTLTGTIPLNGSITLDKGAASVLLTSPQLTLGTGTEGSSLSFSVNGGPEAKVFSLDTSEIQKSVTKDGALDLKGLLATMSTEGAASLNTALGTNAFTTGQPVGDLTVILPAKSGS